ncbi:MAG: pentapeptide repeat-containing protein [Acidobacteriota bacterium]
MTSDLLEQWRTELKKVDKCPYVGPRPQTEPEDGRGTLVGRTLELERLVHAVRRRPLVVVHGRSGVGKSSLLQNGLFSDLFEAGFDLLCARSWSDDICEADEYVARCVKTTHDFVKPKVRDSVASWLDDQNWKNKVGARPRLSQVLERSEDDADAVLVLDQFEELLRRHAGMARKVLAWVRKLGYRHNTRVVVSLRTEELHRLSELLRGVKPFSMDSVTIEAITAEELVRDIIEKGRERCETSPQVSRDAADYLVAQFIGLQKHASTKPPGLLELQATLYSLHFRALTTGVTLPDVQALENENVSGADLFSKGLRVAIGLKIDHADEASKSQIDEFLRVGARTIIRRLAPHLSTGDFKIPVPRHEALQLTLERELGVLGPRLLAETDRPPANQNEQVNQIAKDEYEALRKHMKADFPFKSLKAEWNGPPRDGESTSVSTPSHRTGAQHRVTAGPMMSESAFRTLREEIRRVAMGILWLEQTEIVRVDPDGNIMLTHDGAGPALADWGAKERTTWKHATRQLTARPGEHYYWKGEGALICDTTIANVNWGECRITADFARVVFVNCNFTASRFDTCTFQGVTFVNCLLDDANFEHCTFDGTAGLKRIVRERDKAGLAPSFTVEMTKEEHDWYVNYANSAQTDGSSYHFFSDSAGLPATLGSVPDKRFSGDYVAHVGHTAGKGPELLEPATGGAAMVGGRLCFLTLYRCLYTNHGEFAFHHVSGGGLDIVEQEMDEGERTTGKIIVWDGAVRGISVGREGFEDGRPLALHFVAGRSWLAHVYFSTGLRGIALFADCRLVGLINASDNSDAGLRVRVQDSRYLFLVNTCAPFSGSTEESRAGSKEGRVFDAVRSSDSRFSWAEPKSPKGSSLDARVFMGQLFEAMDYRANPEMRETRERRRRSERSRDGSLSTEGER